MTPGPSFERYNDVYFAAYRGLYGENPTNEQESWFYHQAPWGYPSDTEYAVRIMTVYGLKWSEVIKRLRSMGQ